MSRGRFTQEDPIGIAGGLNLYGYANGDPINYSDPFGLKSQVACRPVGGDNHSESGVDPSAGHCAVRVVDEERDIDITIELAPTGFLRNRIYTAGSGDERTTDYAGEWFDIGVPEGMTGQEFDDAILKAALAESGAAQQRGYGFGGSKNSNRFIYNIVTAAGGRVPLRATARFLFVPGICGGSGLSRGNNCSR